MDNWDTVNMQLLAELKMIFPEISEEKIHDCIIQNSKDKEACIKVLTRMNEDYLFGCQSPIGALSISDKFNKSCHNGETAENNESKETCDSELDIFIPEETLNFRFLLNEEKKSLNLKDCNQPILQETNNTDKSIGNQYPQRKSTIHSAPVISSASHPFGLMDNGNVLPTSIQSELPSNIDISHLLSQNDVLSKDILKWNNNHNEFFAQLQSSAQFSRQNFSRGYSYPIPDPLALRLQNIPSLSQSSLYHFNNHLQAKDYSTPLFVAVTSPQFLAPSYMTSHPSVGLLPSSPNVQRRNSPVSSHLTACYTSPLSTVLPSSLSSSVPHVPSFSYPSPICPPHQQQSSTGNSSHSPTPITSSNLHYIYEHSVTEDQLRERIGVKKNAQCTTIFPQTYELFPKQDFMPSTYSPNLPPSMDHYNSQFTHQMPSFLPTPSHSRPDKNNEMDYIKALLPYQMNSYKLITNELLKMKNLRYALRMDVSSREQELSQIRQQQQFPNMEEIQKLKEEIIKLRVERDCLAMELDFHIKGQESTNTIEENFYEHIFTGPTGSICPAPNNGRAQNSNSNHKDEDDQSNKWNCSKCTYANHPDLRDCEICESPRVMIMPN